jgi:hypothetical protein
VSELTICNYCSLKDMRRRAKEEGKKVVVKPAQQGGFDVFKDGERISWMKEISNKCAC